ncbi:urea transporter 2-like [Pseudochaenichthys georgianus]|uniref:urea transporter 2-like n=1 Tax=Pseudochaenichthys georgianus TaxID=52239 RepID=UPI0039C26E7D
MVLLFQEIGTPQSTPVRPPRRSKLILNVSILCFVLVVQLLDWVLRGVAQVMLLNNPISGLLIVGGLFLQNPWWALNALIGTFISTVSALLLGQNRGAVSAGLHGYSGTLVGMLMAVVSAKGSWYWWLLLPNVFMSMLCPVVSSALSSLLGKWDLPILTLPFNILLFVHVAATGGHHPYFPQRCATSCLCWRYLLPRGRSASRPSSSSSCPLRSGPSAECLPLRSLAPRRRPGDSERRSLSGRTRRRRI